MARVYVYRNIRTRKWSVRHAGRVIAAPEDLLVRNASFQVSEPGRQRCLAEGRKNVHAYVTASSLEDIYLGEDNSCAKCGDEFDKLYDELDVDGKGWEQVRYNPKRDETFIRMSGGWPPKPAPPSNWCFLSEIGEAWIPEVTE